MKNQEVKFQLRGIDIVDVSLDHPKTTIPKQCQFNFDINIEHRINGEENIVVVAPIIAIRINNGETERGKFQADIVFQVQNLKDFLDEETKQYNLPAQFITTLNSISLSTTRGLMFAQFKGTFLHGAVLPIVNPGDLKSE
jgi:DNA gyrase inhibitor GyrI